jgi:hypothetical protein
VIATIEQLLHGEAQKVPLQRERRQTGVAMFSGKAAADRHAWSETRATRGGSTSSGHPSPANEPPRGFFSMPLMNDGKETGENPFFNPRRRSDGDEVRPTVEQEQQAEPSRPQMPKEDSASTVRGEFGSDEGPKNASAEPGGSGLPQKDGAPVGQPQDEPAGINFRDRLGDKHFSAEEASYSAPGQARAIPLDVQSPQLLQTRRQ